jgi:hypothetical protein
MDINSGSNIRDPDGLARLSPGEFRVGGPYIPFRVNTVRLQDSAKRVGLGAESQLASLHRRFVMARVLRAVSRPAVPVPAAADSASELRVQEGGPHAAMEACASVLGLRAGSARDLYSTAWGAPCSAGSSRDPTTTTLRRASESPEARWRSESVRPSGPATN